MVTDGVLGTGPENIPAGTHGSEKYPVTNAVTGEPGRLWNGLPVPDRYWAILAITFGVSVSVLDGTVTNVALPTIARDLGATPASSIWVVNAYQLATVVSLLSLSALGNIVGYRKVYIGGLFVFMFASLGCALAGTMPLLILARVLQGFGAAALASVNTTLIRIIYPQHFLGRGMGINALVVAVSSVAGPTVAAGILSVASWSWLFAVNLPVCVVALVLSYRYLPDNHVKSHKNGFDWKGAVLNALTFGLLIVSIDGYSHGIHLLWIGAGLVLALAAGYFFVRGQLRRSDPLLPVDLLRIPIFSISIGTSVCSFIAQMLAMVSLPFFLQGALGRSEVATGLLMTAWPATIMVIAPLAGFLVERVHAGILGAVGLTIMASGLLLLAFLPADPSNTGLVWRMVLCGLGFGLFQSPNNSIIIASSPPDRSGSASGMLATARLLGQATGAALTALMFRLAPVENAHVALLVAGILALAAAVLSSLRISLVLPSALRR